MRRSRSRASRVRQFGDPALRQPATPVVTFGESLRTIVSDLFGVMQDADGVGLAANQIGLPLAVFVYDCEDGQGRRHRGAVVNPRLVATWGEVVTAEEGCLSLVGVFDPTPRPAGARVEGCDQWGRPIVVEGDGLLGRCLQHEVDHLRGRLYTDLLQPESEERHMSESASESASESERREVSEQSDQAQQSGQAQESSEQHRNPGEPTGYVGSGPEETAAQRDADAVRAAEEWPLQSEFTDPMQSPLPPRAMPRDESGLPPA